MTSSVKGLLAVAFVVVGAASCGGDSGPATIPTPTVTAPTITTSTDHVFIGESVTFTATGTNVRWGGDAPDVATVDPATGRVTGVANGWVTIWAENAGGRATRLLRGMPSFAGTWKGSFVVAECRDSGQMQSWARFCQKYRVGDSVDMGLTVTQSGDTLQIVGIQLGDLEGSMGVTGWRLLETGGWYFIGPIEARMNGAGVLIRILDGALESTTAGVSTGSYYQIWEVSGLTGEGVIRSEIRTLTRTAGGPSITASPRRRSRRSSQSKRNRFHGEGIIAAGKERKQHGAHEKHDPERDTDELHRRGGWVRWIHHCRLGSLLNRGTEDTGDGLS
jgi:hypothetical protein